MWCLVPPPNRRNKEYDLFMAFHHRMRDAAAMVALSTRKESVEEVWTIFGTEGAKSHGPSCVTYSPVCCTRTVWKFKEIPNMEVKLCT